jgi:uncharacterized repeat protein (TIGR01451 family)
MKKIYSILFAFSTTFLFATAPLAGDDNLCVSQFSSNINYLANDFDADGDLDFSSVDLDPATPGQQTSFGGFVIDSTGNLIGFPTDSNYNTFSYTISDLMGNVSNIANVSIVLVPNPTEITFTFSSNSNTFYSNVGGFITFSTPYSVFFPAGGDSLLTIPPGTAPGIYTIDYVLSTTFGGNCQGATQASISYEVLPSITFNMTGTYSDYNADGFTNVGDVINYQFTVSNLSEYSLSNVSVTDSSMTISGTIIPILASGVSDTTTFTGIHVLTLADIMAGSVTEDASVTGYDSFSTLVSNTATTTTSLGITDAIKMNAFLDLNGNNLQDIGEENFTNGEFHYELNGDGIIRNIINPTGMFTIYETNPANIYNLSYTINSAFVSVHFPLTINYSGVQVLTGSGVTTYNFPIVEIPFNDLNISLIPSRGPVPGFSYSNTIRFENKGTSTITSGTVTFNHGANVSIGSVLGSTPITNGFTFPFTNLLRHEVRYITVPISTPVIPTVSLGDLVTNTASITIPPSDIHPLDNTSTLTQDIRGAYDPNDKMESHGEKILFSSFSSSDYLTYTIRFENTGTGNAINIKVDDVLDAKLDATSVRMIDASALYTLERTGSNLSWKFSGINLPPSVSSTTTTGKGYIVFQVKPNAGYAVGDIIPNTANIYFDFNPAIVTNTFQTEFVSTLTTNQFATSNIQIFPNPVNDILKINSNSTILSTEIADINGRIIQSSSQSNSEVVLNIEEFKFGVYLLKVTTQNGTSTQKFVKN